MLVFLPFNLICMAYETVTTQIKDHCMYITLSRPERLNAFDIKLGKELAEVLNIAARDESVKVVVMKGTGKGFCGGGDVKEMHTAKDKPAFLRDLTKVIHQCVIAMRTMEKPVIAAVNGASFGAGFSLALAADIIIASETATFGTAFLGIGLAPGCGTQLFTQLVGYQKACEYILTSKTFSAKEAEELGIINKIVQKDDLDASAEIFVNIFRRSPTIAVGKAKMLINKSLDNNFLNHLELESITAAFTAGTNDFSEGVRSFNEKRKPIFKGT